MRFVEIERTLRAAIRHEHRGLRVRRQKNETDLRELVGAGLVQATFSDGSPGSVTAIRGVTAAGQRFLQKFRRGYRLCDAP